MKMRSIVFSGIVIGLLPFSHAFAAELKIGVVDVKSAFENTNAYRQGLNRLKDLAARKQKELDAMQQQIEKAEKELLGQSMAMSPERLAAKESEIKDLRKLYTRKQQDAQEEIVSERSKLDGALGMKFRNVIAEYGKKGNYDLILPNAPQIVLYANPSQDITGDITKLLDK